MTTAIQTNLTAEDFERQYADVAHCELQRGEVLRLTAGGWNHSRICIQIGYLLTQWTERTNLGRALGNEAGLITSRDPDTVRGIDVAYFSFQRVPVGNEPTGFATVPPELAVEVVGKGQGWGKMVEKAAEYLRVGVTSVWIVDPKTRCVHIYRNEMEPQRFEENDTLVDEAILPGFAVNVAEFFK